MDCVIDFHGNGNDHLHLIEFILNNSYYSRIQMDPYEAFYMIRCRSTIEWYYVGEDGFIGLDFFSSYYGEGESHSRKVENGAES